MHPRYTQTDAGSKAELQHCRNPGEVPGGQGVSKEIEDMCNEHLYIKMNGNCESLNASVAASILMYEINNK